MPYQNRGEAWAMLGIQGSIFSLRLGTHRNFELTLWHAVITQLGDDHIAVPNGISLTHVW
ncbi:MAG TPA: hypothetical protein VMF89_17990 [Polyangiales bacterium]|nr:hypothetical protein [Polyangiales bacterium]